jgi:hypothetical protein
MGGTLVNRDVESMTQLLRETEQRHRSYEAGAAKHDWSAWYAAYIVARECGKTPDDAAREATRHAETSRAHTQE